MAEMPRARSILIGALEMPGQGLPKTKSRSIWEPGAFRSDVRPAARQNVQTMTLASVRPSLRATAFLRRFGRTALLALAWLLIAIGVVGSVLPWHLGLPILAIGLVIVLRSSFQARRRFISLQRRHPKIVFPIRRLLRRDPEVLPVAWQQVLRFERMVLPRTWRPARRLRRRFVRRTVIRAASG
jgi:hypothetical protein